MDIIIGWKSCASYRAWGKRRRHKENRGNIFDFTTSPTMAMLLTCCLVFSLWTTLYNRNGNHNDNDKYFSQYLQHEEKIYQVQILRQSSQSLLCINRLVNNDNDCRLHLASLHFSSKNERLVKVEEAIKGGQFERTCLNGFAESLAFWAYYWT